MEDEVVIKLYENIHVGCIDGVQAEMDVRVRDECLLKGVNGDYPACLVIK